MALFLVICASAVHFDASAKILGAPFMPETDARFNCLEVGSSAACKGQPGFTALSIPWANLIQGTATGAVGQFPISVWKQTVSAVVTAAAHNTSIVLPAKTLIRQAWIRINTAITPSGTTSAFSCLGANDIFTATDETGASAGAIVAGAETSTGATMLDVPSGCTVVYTGGAHTGTAGAIELFIETVPTN